MIHWRNNFEEFWLVGLLSSVFKHFNRYRSGCTLIYWPSTLILFKTKSYQGSNNGWGEFPPLCWALPITHINSLLSFDVAKQLAKPVASQHNQFIFIRNCCEMGPLLNKYALSLKFGLVFICEDICTSSYKQGSERIRKWVINWCTSQLIHKFTFCRLMLVVEKFEQSNLTKQIH